MDRVKKNNIKIIREKVILLWICESIDISKSSLLPATASNFIPHKPWTTYHLKLHSHQTTDQPATNADHFFFLLGWVWSGKKLPALIEERIYPRSTPAVSQLYPWCTHAQIPLFPTNPVLPADQSPLCTTNPRPIPDATSLSTLNIGPTPICMLDFQSQPQMIYSSKCNATDSLMRVQYMKCAYFSYC